jgi:hypothetical protein
MTVELYSESVYCTDSLSDEIVASNSVRAFFRSSSNDSSKPGFGNGGGLSGSKESSHISTGADLLYSDLRSSIGRDFGFCDLGVYGGYGGCSAAYLYWPSFPM